MCLFCRNDLEYQYQKTTKELELKRNEVVNLTKEYEQKIRLKEVGLFDIYNSSYSEMVLKIWYFYFSKTLFQLEEYGLTKRLAELAIATTMEDHKQRTMNMNFETWVTHWKLIKSGSLCLSFKNVSKVVFIFHNFRMTKDSHVIQSQVK